MRKRFVFGLGLTLGFCIGVTHAVGKMMSVDEIRKACANRVANKISDCLFGKSHCTYSYDWCFATKGDCVNAWHDICEIIQLYGQITVAEVKEIIGSESASYDDVKRGWTSLTKGMYLKEKDGTWAIHLPEPKRLPKRRYYHA